MYEEQSRPKSTIILIVVTVILVLALGGLGYWYWYKTNALNKQISDKASQIIALEAEKAKMDEEMKGAQESATSSNGDYQISELKISFKPSSRLAGLVYAYDQKNKIAAFTTRDLSYKLEASAEVGDPYKLDGGSLGLVYILEDSGTNDDTCQVTIKKIGTRTVCYSQPQQTGTDDKKVADQLVKAVETIQADLKASVQATN